MWFIAYKNRLGVQSYNLYGYANFGIRVEREVVKMIHYGWSSGVAEWSSVEVEWSSGVVEWSSMEVEWSSRVVEWSSRVGEWSCGVMEKQQIWEGAQIFASTFHNTHIPYSIVPLSKHF